MNIFASTIENLKSHVKDYIGLRIEEAKLNVADRSSEVLANIIATVVIFLFLSLCTLFISIGVARIISDSLHSNYAGYFIVAGFYLVVGIVIYRFREPLLRTPIMNKMLRAQFRNRTHRKSE